MSHYSYSLQSQENNFIARQIDVLTLIVRGLLNCKLIFKQRAVSY